MSVYEEARGLQGDLAELRHALHREPEVGLELPRTQEKVLAALDGLPVEVTVGRQLSSVTAVLRGGRPGPTVLLRGDMDALPVTERSGVPYASQVEGCMHACGHDLHTTMLAGAARVLAGHRDELAGNVVFMFQPGEEGLGGARLMIEEGVLDASGERASAAYALHMTSSKLPLGFFALKPGPMLAAVDTLNITVRGRGGHASAPHASADPIPAACEMVTALQTMVTRKFSVFDPVVVTVGSFHAGTAENVIPDEAVLQTTVRSFSAEARATMRVASVQLVNGIARAHGLSVDADYIERYPVTVNDGAEAAYATEVAQQMAGRDRVFPMPFPVTAAEDFSYVLEQVPGAFVFLGGCPGDRDAAGAPDNHSAEAVFDDAALSEGAGLLAALAWNKLGVSS